jgi:ankyrin repeat protein
MPTLSATTVEYDGATIAIERNEIVSKTTAHTLRCASRKTLTPWDTLLAHDTSDRVLRKESKFDGNPFTPKELRVLSTIPPRYLGRAWGNAEVFGGSTQKNIRRISTVRTCRIHASRGDLVKKYPKSNRRDKKVSLVVVSTPSVNCRVEGDDQALKASPSGQLRNSRAPSMVSFVTLQQHSRSVNDELLSESTIEARSKLRRLISEHKLLASSNGLGIRRILDLGMSRSSSVLSSSRTMPLGSVTALLSRSSTTPSPRSGSLLPRASTNAPVCSGRDTAVYTSGRGASSRNKIDHYKWPVVEVFFEGEDAPVLTLRDAVHPLDSVASLRSTIDKEFRDMAGGLSLAEETNWTFSSFHPPVVVWLSALLHDFKTFYSDSEHSRYTGALAKEMKLRVARHREQADNLQKYLQIVRLSLESCASVEQLCPRVHMNMEVYNKHKGLPRGGFYNGSIRPQLPPKGPPPSVGEVRCFLAPVMGAIRAQIERMNTKAANPNAAMPPPPVECGIPMFSGSATRVGNRLVNMARRRTAVRRYGEDVESGSLEARNTRNGSVELAIPRITLKKINPTFSWDRADVFMTQIEEICRDGRGATREDLDPTQMDTNAGEDETMGILLGGVDKGIRSPPRSRSPTSPSGSEAGMQSRSPTQRIGTSPTQSSNGASSSFVAPTLSAEVELQRILEEGITPLYRCDAIGWSYVDYAVWFRRPTIVTLLCQFGANPSNQDHTNGDTVLHRFIKLRTRTVKDLQSFKAILDHCAPRHLLAIFQARNFQGHTPLSLATSLRDFVVVQAILATANSPRCRSTMTAARFPSGDEETVMCSVFTFDYFIDECSLPHLLWVEDNCFADPANAVGEILGASLLHRAMMAPSFSVLSPEARDHVIATMLTRVDPLTKDISERTAFHCAARCGCTKWLVPFLDHMHARAGSVLLASSPMSFYGGGSANGNRLGSRHQSNHPAMMTGTGKVVGQSADLEGNTVLHTALLWCNDQNALDVDIYAFASHQYVLPHVQLDQQNRAGDTVLHLVMQRRQLLLAELLCRSLKYESAGFLQRLFTLRNADGDTILGCAIKAQFAAGIRRLLEVESIAEVSLHARASFDRLPLLLAVDVVGAKQAVGTQFATMDQRPHCLAREESDCLYILLKIAQDHRLLHDMIHATSGPRNETALHGAARHFLWHPCAMLMSFGASPNKVDGEGRTALAISFAHPHDTSLPRLMIANDTSEWHTGETLRACLTARGAASCSSAFMDDCFFHRYPYPWATDAAFVAPILDIACTSGNLYVLERMLCLGVRPLPGRGSELFSLLLNKYQEASDYNERGGRWKRMEHLYIHVTSPVRPRELHDVVEGLLVTMAEDRSILSDVSYAFLAQAVRADFCKLAASLLRRLQRDDTINSAVSAVKVTPRPRRGAMCVAAELIRSQTAHAWPPTLRRDILRFDAQWLLSSEHSVDFQSWQQAVALAASTCQLEALVILTSTSISCTRDRGKLPPPLPRTPYVPIASSQAPLRLECLWMSRRCTLPLPLLVTLMMIQNQTSAVEVLLATLPSTRMTELLLEPIAMDGQWLASIGRERVLRWATREASACPLAIASTSSVVTESQKMMWQSVCNTVDIASGGQLIAEGLRDGIMTAIESGAWSCVEFLVKDCVPRLPRAIQGIIFASRGVDSTSIFLGTALEQLVACEAPLPIDMLVWLVPMLLTPSQADFSAGTTSRMFTAIRQASTPRQTSTKPISQSHTPHQQRRIRDILLVFLMGGIEHIALPQRVTANRPTRQQSITALEQLHLDAMQNCTECGELVRALQHVALTISTSMLCRNRLAATLTVDHLHVMVTSGLVLSLAHVHCVVAPSAKTFVRLEGALSQTECGGSIHHRATPRVKYLSAVLLYRNDHVPDVVVNAVIDACRAEVSEWRQHTQWWVDHVLDIYHPSNVRRIPVQVRRALPILSMMRDIARSEPATTRGAMAVNGSVVASMVRQPSRHHGASPLHCAVFANREAAVVQMLQEGSRELDVNVLDAFGRTSLVWAAKLGHHGIASQLVSTGVDILIEDVYGLSSLAYAADANMVELILADDDGEDAANSRSSKPHRTSPLMHHLRCGRGQSAMALLNSVVCENCVLETMVDGVTGETLVHLAAARRELHATVLPALLEGRLPLTYVLQTDAQGWTARDYCAPRSAADVLLEAKGVPRTIRLWPEGKYSIGLRDFRSVRHNISFLVTGESTSSDSAVWKDALCFHLRTTTESSMTIDELSWERASRGEDRELLELLERGHRDMQVVRLYGIPAPRNEKDKRSVAKDVNLLLQMRFGGCRGGCRLVFPTGGEDEVTEPHPYLTIAAEDAAAASSLPRVVPASHLPEGIDPSAPYAAALMIDDTRIPQLMSANSGLSVKNRPLRVIREPPRGPQYRTLVPPYTSTLLHQICKNGCVRSLSYVLRNNASQGSPNELICRLLSATYDENGLTPFHVAVVYRQWAIVVELLRNRIPLGPAHQNPRHARNNANVAAPTLSVGPQQMFSSLVQLMSFQWLAGTGITPSNAKPLLDALLPPPSMQGCPHLTLLTSTRFTGFDAEVAAYALMRTSLSTDIMLLARMQRIVLTSILDVSTAAACTAVITSFADRCDEAFRLDNLLGSLHAHSRDQQILHKLLEHYRNGIMQIDVDHEGADARDSASERERTKALLMYQIQGGSLFRVLESALLDTFMLGADLRDDAHPSLRVYRWVSLLQIDGVRFVCCKSKTDIPTASISPSSFNKGCFAIRLSFLVDATGQLRCPDLTSVLRDFFFTPILDAAWTLCTTVALHGVHVAILDEETLLARRFVTAVRARRYLEEQQSTPAPLHLTTADRKSDDDEDVTEPVDAAVVCWQHLKRHFEETSGPAGDADNRSFTSSSMSNQSCAATSVQVERLARFVLDMCTLLTRDVIPNTIQRSRDGQPRHVLLPGGRRVTLRRGCEVTVVLCRQAGRSSGETLAINEVRHQEDARVASFSGLALLQREWQGPSASDKEPASPGLLLLASNRAFATYPEGEGLRLLDQARRVVDGEQSVCVVCPLHESVDDIEEGSILLGVPFAACSLYRGSQWAGNQVGRYVWKSSLWSSLIVTSRPPSRPTTATRPASMSGRPPTRGSLVVSPYPLAIDPADIQRPASALSLTDISAHIEANHAAEDSQRSQAVSGLLCKPVRIPFTPPQSLESLADALDDLGERVSSCFATMAAQANALPSVKADSGSSRSRFPALVEFIAPFLMDPFFVWTTLRAVNRQTYSAVIAAACKRTLFPICHVTLRLREVASVVSVVRSQWEGGLVTLPPAALLPALQTLCTSHLQFSIRVAENNRCNAVDDSITATQLATAAIADAQFVAFLSNPLAMLHHVASTKGIYEASRLPQWLAQRGHRTTKQQQQQQRSLVTTTSKPAPPSDCAKRRQRASLSLIETTFAVLYPSLATLRQVQRFLELWQWDECVRQQQTT